MMLRACAVALTLALAAAPAAAHKPSRVTAREFVRLAGTFAGGDAANATPGAERAVAVTVQGRERTFVASDWQVFALVTEPAAEGADGAPKLPPRLVLQGARDAVARVAAARPEQRVSILAERRPGSAELFVLALDLCPSD